MSVVEVEPIPKAINRQAVEVLEAALERARSGEIAEVAVAMVYSGGNGTGWRHSGSDNVAALTGATSYLLHQLHQLMDGAAH